MAVQDPDKDDYSALLFFGAPRIGLEAEDDGVPTQFVSATGDMQIGTPLGTARRNSEVTQGDGEA